MTVAALVLAAGRGTRLGSDRPKGFVHVAGEPLIARSIRAMAATPEIDRIVPVVPPGDLERYREVVTRLRDVAGLRAPVRGGAERQDSVRAGLRSLADDVEWVVVHDGARPLVEAGDVARVLEAARRSGAALLAEPVRDTIKRVRRSRVQTIPRSECYAAQTPQVFRRALLRDALEKAEAEGLLGTDDGELVERLGHSVEIVLGSPDNFKITYPGDVEAAERVLRARGAA